MEKKRMKKEKRFSVALVAASLIRRPVGKLLFVFKEGDWTIPTEHYKEQEENDLEGTVRRGAEEELRIRPEEISIKESLGTLIRNKGSPAAAKSMEIFHCRVTHKVAEKIQFCEGGETRQAWLNPWEALKLPNLDDLAREAIRRYQDKDKYYCYRISSKLCLFGNLWRRALLWKRKEHCLGVVNQ